jgi:hypothetical protein
VHHKCEPATGKAEGRRKVLSFSHFQLFLVEQATFEGHRLRQAGKRRNNINFSSKQKYVEYFNNEITEPV